MALCAALTYVSISSLHFCFEYYLSKSLVLAFFNFLSPRI